MRGVCLNRCGVVQSQEEMSKVEPTAVMSFLKKTIGDIHQLSTLTMKYKKENEDGARPFHFRLAMCVSDEDYVCP